MARPIPFIGGDNGIFIKTTSGWRSLQGPQGVQGPNGVPGVVPKLFSAIAASVPLSWWSLNELTGNFADNRPAGIVGTHVASLQRGISRGPDRYGGSQRVASGQGTALATFGNVYGFAGVAPFSFLLLHRPETFGTNSRRIMIKNDSTSGPFMGLNTGGGLFVTRMGGGAPSLVAPTSVQLNEWNLYAMVFDGTGLYCYLNGDSSYQVESGAMPSSAANLRLHGEPGNSANWGADGQYSNFAVWDRALSSVEIESFWKCVI
jgi:hypothetical protein